MKVGVVGKGGSGKSSVSWMLMQAGLQQGYDVWGLDADYNQSLAPMFGVANSAIEPLADHRDRLTRHVIGTRRDVTVETFGKATRPARGSQLVALSCRDPMLGRFIASPCDRLHLLRVGELRDSDRGVRCYHGRTAAADVLLGHLAPLDDRQMLVVDFTAGVDPFASPLYLKLDVFVLVVEPTLKGVAVARQWKALLRDTAVSLVLAGNKIEAPDDVSWLVEKIGGPLGVVLWKDAALRESERGRTIGWSDLSPGNRSALSEVVAELPACRDPARAAQRAARLDLLATRERAGA